MDEKKKKDEGAEIIAFYVGGAKLHASTTLSKPDLDKLIEGRMEGNHKFVTIDTVNEDPKVLDDSVTLVFDKMLFYTTFQSAPKSGLILPANPGKLEVVSG